MFRTQIVLRDLMLGLGNELQCAYRYIYISKTKFGAYGEMWQDSFPALGSYCCGLISGLVLQELEYCFQSSLFLFGKCYQLRQVLMRYFVHVDCVENHFFLLNKSANAASLFIHVLFRNCCVIVKKSFLVSSFDIVDSLL